MLPTPDRRHPLAQVLVMLVGVSALAGLSMPATAQTPAAGEIQMTSLARVVIPAGAWPREGALLDWVELTIEPGSRSPSPRAVPPWGAPRHVVSGRYATSVDGPLHVLRGGQIEDVARGEPVVLIAGEAAYYPDNAAAQSFGTDGTEPAVIWFASLGGDVPPPPEGQISKVQRGFVWAPRWTAPWVRPMGPSRWSCVGLSSRLARR